MGDPLSQAEIDKLMQGFGDTDASASAEETVAPDPECALVLDETTDDQIVAAQDETVEAPPLELASFEGNPENEASQTGLEESADRPAQAVQTEAFSSPRPAAALGATTTSGLSSVQNLEFGALPSHTQSTDAPRSIDLLLDVQLQMTVELGRKDLTIKDALALGPGSVVELDRVAGDPVDLFVNNKLIARGEVVVIDENFGVRVTEVVKPGERVAKIA